MATWGRVARVCATQRGAWAVTRAAAVRRRQRSGAAWLRHPVANAVCPVPWMRAFSVDTTSGGDLGMHVVKATRPSSATSSSDITGTAVTDSGSMTAAGSSTTGTGSSGGSSSSSDLLKDRFGRQHTYLRISLTEKCNLRCQYCMPENGVPLTPLERMLTTEELMRLAGLFVQCGVDKIRLTGGEPLVRRDATEICRQLMALPGMQAVTLTSNGLLVKRHLAALVEAGVTGINISLDTLVAAKFLFITRRQGLDRVLQAIDACIDAGLVVKVNCVVMNGVNEDEIVDFVEFTRTRNVDVRFIEYMPFDDNAWSDRKLIPYLAMLEKVQAVYPDVVRLRNSPNDTAKTYHVPGFQGKFGFITSMTQHFCGGCNRLRLTADGNIKACLFGSDEFSLRDAMRAGATDDELLDIIGFAVQKKHAVLGGNGDMYGIAKNSNRPMITIGG